MVSYFHPPRSSSVEKETCERPWESGATTQVTFIFVSLMRNVPWPIGRRSAWPVLEGVVQILCYSARLLRGFPPQCPCGVPRAACLPACLGGEAGWGRPTGHGCHQPGAPPASRVPDGHAVFWGPSDHGFLSQAQAEHRHTVREGSSDDIHFSRVFNTVSSPDSLLLLLEKEVPPLSLPPPPLTLIPSLPSRVCSSLPRTCCCLVCRRRVSGTVWGGCLLYTSDAADETSTV